MSDTPETPKVVPAEDFFTRRVAKQARAMELLQELSDVLDHPGDRALARCLKQQQAAVKEIYGLSGQLRRIIDEQQTRIDDLEHNVADLEDRLAPLESKASH